MSFPLNYIGILCTVGDKKRFQLNNFSGCYNKYCLGFVYNFRLNETLIKFILR
jgi:hypothetical protein